jgi:hypothetical protein
MLKRMVVLAACMVLAAMRWAAAEANGPLRVYYIGNSVTDTIQYEKLAQLSASRDLKLEWSRQMIPGSPLFLLWRSDNGFIKQEYGPSRKALSEFAWDVVTVQPFDRKLTKEGETPDPEKSENDDVIIQQMIETAVKQNPAVRFYVYSRWPRIRSKDLKSFSYDKNDYNPNEPGQRPSLEGVMDWAEFWDKKYTGGWDGTEETRDYFEQVVARLRAAHPSLEQPVRMIPVGDVIYALDKKIKAGAVPGFDSVWLIYKDGIHMNHFGSYLTALTFFATIFKQTPVGLPTEPYGDIPPEIARIYQETVWDVVSSHPLAGVN